MSNAVKDKLLSVLSHELINPLHTIMGFSALLRNKIEKYDKDKIIERVEIIDNSIRNIYFLLDNLTSWSNFYRNNVKITRDFISINEVIQENISLFKYIIQLKELNVTTTENSVVTVYSDKKMVNSIIRNILSNAVKFTPKQGEISIKVKENKSNITLLVEDTGIGIAPEELELINNADKDNPDLIYSGKKSIGLGLMLSRSHAENIGGSLKINSSQNKGTSVIISIPRG
jgi:signal transduction histidine kinase